MPPTTLDSDADRPFFKRPPRHSKPKGPVPDLNDLEPKTARVGLPKGLRDLEMVHELCLEHNAVIPEYRAEQYEPGRRASDRKRVAEWVRIYLGTNAWIMFDFLSFYSRQYQLTTPGIVKRLNDFGAVDKTSAYFVHAGIRKLIDNGLAERLPVRDHKKALGFMVRLKHRSEWPITLNPGGKTLKAIKAQVGYNETQGRVVPPKRGDRPFHNGTAAAIYRLDGFTGEVIEKVTGAVAFVIHHRSRERWGAFKFLKKHVLHQCGNPWGQVPRETGYIKEGVKNSEPKVLKKGTSGEVIFSEASSPVGGLSQQPGEAGGAAAPLSTQTTPDRSAPPADAEGGADEEPFDDLMDVVPELKHLHREWRKHERPREPGEVDGYGGKFLAKNNRYNPARTGKDIVPPYVADRSYMIGDVPFRAGPVHAPFYCSSGVHYTITDVQRWYLNAPEALMIRALNGDVEGTELLDARLWMRQFVDHARAGTHVEFYNCFIAVEAREFANTAFGHPRRVYTNAELKKHRKLRREIDDDEKNTRGARLVPESQYLETMTGNALDVLSDLRPRDMPTTWDEDVFNNFALTQYAQQGEDWVMPDPTPENMAAIITRLWGAALNGDGEQIDNILDATDRPSRLAALYHTIPGIEICRMVRDAVRGSRFTGHYPQMFADAFRTTPADVLNEQRRHVADYRRMREKVVSDEFELEDECARFNPLNQQN